MQLLSRLWAAILAIQWGCAAAPPRDPGYEGPSRDSLAAVLGTKLEDALGAVWPQEDLVATMREIPSETGLPTARQAVAARLVGRLEAGQAGGDLRAAMAEALAYTNEIENRREREHSRLEAIGDRAGLDSLWVEARRRSWADRTLRRTLAWVLWGMEDPATISLLADARDDGLSLEPFGEAAVSPILDALAGANAYRDQITRLPLADLAGIAGNGELPAESTDAVAAVVQRFLSGETLRAMEITDPWANVLSSAIDLAVVLGFTDPARIEQIRAYARDRLAERPILTLGGGC